ncbi:unnamed protein product [Calypogeia fissa]
MSSGEVAIANIISNHPMTLEEDRMRKRRARGDTTWVATLIPGLPDDVVRRILVNLPRSSWFNLRSVSKAWRKTVEDPSFYHSRVDLKLTEEWCYTEAWHPETKLVSWFAFDFNQSMWTALPPIPKKRGLDPEIFGRASSSLRGELYVVGGKAGVSGPTLREVFIYSPFTHRWRKGKSMITTRHSPLMFSIFECKIYVMGGFDFLNNVIDTGECYDIDTDEWTLVGNVDQPEILCPSWYHTGWQVPWTRFHFMDDEHYISYKTIDERQVVKYYVPRNGKWVFTEHRDKAKALMRYSLGGVVNMDIVMLDWVNSRLRYTYHSSRTVGWETVPGLADLNWVAILTTNPKVSAVGSKFVMVGRGLSVWMIETNPTLLKARDRKFIDIFPAKVDVQDMEPLLCVTVVA